ncbi:inorganic pyrophosphatase 2-like [Phragmites australis]|uniref:inorganic pyrophosphatase 2-like n=1 Tax=Phragmites australis TaxID=29695 RepID=UPI002D768A95|nr:inorganic pyrophosphatase 2-like [Phragmites australis]
MAASNGAPLVVFDFDKTIVDCDSDNWVVDALGATQRFDELLRQLPWNYAIDAMMGELHSQGKTIQDIRACLRTAPLSPHVTAAIRSAHALGCELRILSDANTFFIDTILAHHGLAGYFSAIDTNPAHVDAAGRLRIRPYHEFHASAPGHGCALPTCPPNMCKGKVMERILLHLQEEASAGAATAKRRRRAVVYLGDGRGDYCPSLKLCEGDYVMPRTGYPVCDLIAGSPPGAGHGTVRGWAGFEDLGRVLLGIVDNEIARSASVPEEDVAGVGMVPVPECRVLPPLVPSVQEALLPKAVRVPN